MAVLTGGYPVFEANVCYFTDVEKSDASTLYPDNYIAVCAANGITTGKTATTFEPTQFISRYQVVSMVVRMADNLKPGLLQAPPAGFQGTGAWGNDAIHGANAKRAPYNGLLTGLDLDALSPYGNMSRGEVAQVLYNLLNKLPTTPTTGGSTEFGGGHGMVAFVSNRSGNFEIWAMHGDNEAAAVQFTNNSAIDDWPDWSPTGKLAFTRVEANGKVDIYSMNADGAMQTNLTTNAAYDEAPAWSPDGSRIAFDSDRAGGKLQLYVMNADGSHLEQLTNNAAMNADAHWSPDGNELCFVSDRTGSSEIYVISADGTNPMRLTYTGNCYAPVWSPNGLRIAFSSNSGIWLIKPDGTGLRQLTSNSHDTNPCWSRWNQDHVRFHSQRQFRPLDHERRWIRAAADHEQQQDGSPRHLVLTGFMSNGKGEL